jgi:hypothetical protein
MRDDSRRPSRRGEFQEAVGTMKRVAFIAILAALAFAGSARGDVLISDPGSSVTCCSKAIRLGVWYQSYSGGPKSYRVVVENPKGVVVFSRSGTASTTWLYFNYVPPSQGTYTVVYYANGTHSAYRVVARAASNPLISRYMLTEQVEAYFQERGNINIPGQPQTIGNIACSGAGYPGPQLVDQYGVPESTYHIFMCIVQPGFSEYRVKTFTTRVEWWLIG